MSVDNPKLILVCGMSGAGKSTFINIATGSNLPVGHGAESETSEITTQGIPLINLNGVYIQLVDVPGFDDTRDASDTEIFLQLTAWVATRYPGDKRVSGIIYLRSISKPRVDKLEKSFIGMFKAFVGEQHLNHVVLVTNRWNSHPDEGNESLENTLASDEQYLGTQSGQRVHVGRLADKYTQDGAHHIIIPIRDLPHFTLEIQRETIEGQLSALESTAGRRLNDYMRGRAPELVKRAEEALKVAREMRKRLEDTQRAAQEAKDRYEAELCRHRHRECLHQREQEQKFANRGANIFRIGGMLGGPFMGAIGAMIGEMIVASADDDCPFECPA